MSTPSPRLKGIEKIPQPPPSFLVGNMFDVSTEIPIQSLMKLARDYGPIYQLEVMGRRIVVVSSYDLVNELCDETRFDKGVRAALQLIRGFAGDGLFTAYTSEPNWSKAHNILLPSFSGRSMQTYHPMMVEMGEQLCTKWGRLNPEDEIDVCHDMTCLTLDTIGLCGFGYRFNSFYRETNHPFVDALVGALDSAMRTRGLPLEDKIFKERKKRLKRDIAFMNDMVDRIIAERKQAGEALAGKSDLLSAMLSGIDKKTHTRLDDLNIRYQIITFLIAGHETTSGMMSFTINFLLQHPDVLARCYAEVDRVLGDDLSVAPTYAQVMQLTYMMQVLKESLRLWPTAPAFSLYPYKDSVIGGKYLVKPKYNVIVNTTMLHRDTAVWGADAESFDPENFSREAERKRPANAYKPFGNGQRACIGRQFAMHEAALVLGMILQRFTLVDHTNYKLSIKETLTIKPDNLKIRVRLRSDRDRAAVPGRLTVSQPPKASAKIADTADVAAAGAPRHETPLLVLYGSNMGTGDELAHRIAEGADQLGFATTVAPLDDYAGQLPKNGALAIVCASYNGNPPDNARQFCDWLKNPDLGADALTGVRYALFGCGNQDWAATYQAVPRFIDERLAAAGAKRIYERGEGDAREDFDGQFEGWYKALWHTVAQQLKLTIDTTEPTHRDPLYDVEIVPGLRQSPYADQYGAKAAVIAVNRELQTGGARSTRHIEVALPDGMTYRTGDHLGVLPHNSEALVKRVAQRFGFATNSFVRLRRMANRQANLPLDETISVFRLLCDYVELQQVATRRHIQTLVDHTRCPRSGPVLAKLLEDDSYKADVLAKRKSVIDLLEDFPACELPFAVFLELLPPLSPRYYSISSSPLAHPTHAHITVAVVKDAAKSGKGIYEGVCSTYLAGRSMGDVVHASVKDPNSGFRLPDDPATPIIMVGPGTGLAPFRGFLQDRAAQKASGKTVGPALLFFGCRHPSQDYLYQSELEGFAAAGLCDLDVAFSRHDSAPKTYVQDRIWARRDQVAKLLADGARVYVCGDASRMEPDVRATLARILGADGMAALLTQGRYVIDVWAGS